MKNKSYKILVAILVVLFSTTNLAYSAPAVTTSIKSGIVRLSLAMLGVVAFSVIISIGLSLYNRFFVPSDIKNYKVSKNSLRSPSDKDEAIIMYLAKNKLK